MNPYAPETLERLGDHLWHAAVDLLFLDSPTSEPEAWRMNSNRQMNAWARHLGLENPCGATFEIHVARLFLERGFPAVQHLAAGLKDIDPIPLKFREVIWGYREGQGPKRLHAWGHKHLKIRLKTYKKTGWKTLVLPVGVPPPATHPDSMLDVQR